MRRLAIRTGSVVPQDCHPNQRGNADMFYIPADLSVRERANIERDIQGCDGMVSVHFSGVDTHMLEVVYNPQ